MKTLKRYTLDIPTEVSGRPVTNRGVHLQPFGYHGFWMDREAQDQYWTKLMKAMGISWVVLLTEGDSVVENRNGTTPLEVLLDAGIIPIIRDKIEFPDGFVNFRTVERTVDICARYGLHPFWQLYNEPFDEREWRNRKVPPHDEAWGIIAGRWSAGARAAAGAGAYVGFPDGPCYSENPFERLRAAGGLDLFRERVAFYAPHSYGLGRPLWYPYDAVTRHGAALTEEAYSRILDDMASDHQWRDAPVAMVNEQRRQWADPNRTAIDDDTCWRGWEKIAWWAMQSLGEVPPMAMTEGGWTPRARAGVSPVDNRWSYTTPQMVAKKTLRMFDSPSPFFAICPWLLASEDMGGTGWFDDAWHGGAFPQRYGRAKPVISTLQARAPRELLPLSEPAVTDLDDDTRDWDWVHQSLGAKYRRGAEPVVLPGQQPTPPMRLVEVLEYEGPATLEVIVVDAGGLPVEGAAFYHHFPGAPSISTTGDTSPVDEWYDHAVLRWTDAQGRIAFAAGGPACPPESCREAIWPQGKGDVLEHLGLLAGTRNRHLNGVWQLGAVVGEEGGGPGNGGDGGEDGDHGGNDGDGGGDGGSQILSGWEVSVEHRPGPRILAGRLHEAGITLTVADPWDNVSSVLSGSKPEHGPGGFEVLAPHVATYTVRFLDQSFAVQTHEGTTLVTFRRSEGQGGGGGGGGGESGGGGEEGGGGGEEGGGSGEEGGGSGEEGGDGSGTGPRPQVPGVHKLGFYLHVTTTPGLLEAVRDCRPPTILTHANDWGFLRELRRSVSPDTFVVGRLHVTSGQQDEWLDSGDPAARGRAFAEQILSLDMDQAWARGANGRLLVDAWMSLNECITGPASNAYLGGTEEERAAIRARADAYDRFQVAFRQRLKEADSALEAVAFNFAAGNFTDARDYLWWFPRTLEAFVYLGFHEYGWPALSQQLDPQAASSAGTYRQIMEGIRLRHGDRHRIIVTEAGLARMYKYPESKDGDVGWLFPADSVSQEKYWRSLEWYNAFLAQDEFVLGCCLFEVGHSGDWETFRHLGIDNSSQPIQIVPWIAQLRERSLRAGPEREAAEEPAVLPLPAITLRGRVMSAGEPVASAQVRVIGTIESLGADRRAAAHDPELVTWTRSISGFGGHAWNCWQRFVLRSVAGITWEQFEARVAAHNPSLRETDGLFERERTYLLPENPPELRAAVTWDRIVTGIQGNRWHCWVDHVRGKVPGLDWADFAREVVERNPQLEADGCRFQPLQTYVLPRSAGRQLYVRVAWTEPDGWFEFPALPAGDHTLEVSAEGYVPQSKPLSVRSDTALTLDVQPT